MTSVSEAGSSARDAFTGAYRRYGRLRIDGLFARTGCSDLAEPVGLSRYERPLRAIRRFNPKLQCEASVFKLQAA